jgi:hypothetical protein
MYPDYRDGGSIEGPSNERDASIHISDDQSFSLSIASNASTSTDETMLSSSPEKEARLQQKKLKVRDILFV